MNSFHRTTVNLHYEEKNKIFTSVYSLTLSISYSSTSKKKKIIIFKSHKTTLRLLLKRIITYLQLYLGYTEWEEKPTVYNRLKASYYIWQSFTFLDANFVYMVILSISSIIHSNISYLDFLIHVPSWLLSLIFGVMWNILILITF